MTSFRNCTRYGAVVGVSENFSTGTYLSSGHGPRLFELEAFVSWLGSVGLRVQSTTTEPSSTRLDVARGPEPLGEVVLDAVGGVFARASLTPNEVASLTTWMSSAVDDELWYWTSNGNDCFRIDDELADKLQSARRGGIGHPDGTPWDAR